MLAPGDRLAGHYRVVSELGKGGMGRVYLAIHEDLDARIALKELLVPADAEAVHVDRFRTEGRILHHLRHPRLPLVYDFFRDGDKFYLAMEFVDGQPLSQVIHDHGIAEAETVRQWGLQLCDVLEYLHTHDPVIIFRDLKPNNIMITANGELKLIDFGIAKLFDENTGGETSTAIKDAGTPGFAPPEQYGAGTDERADIYALGATLYSVAAGRIPPPSVSLAAGVGTLTPLGEVRPEYPVALCMAIHHMMAVRREDRPANIGVARSELNYAARQADRPRATRAPMMNEATGVLDSGPNETMDRYAADETRMAPEKKGPGFGLLLASVIGLGLLVIALLEVFARPAAAPVASTSSTPSPTPRPVVAQATPVPTAPKLKKKPTATKPPTATHTAVAAVPDPTPTAPRTVVVVLPRTTPTGDVSLPSPPVPPPPPAPTADAYAGYKNRAVDVINGLQAAVNTVPANGKGPGVETLIGLLNKVAPSVTALTHDPAQGRASMAAIGEAVQALVRLQATWLQLKQHHEQMAGQGGQGGQGPPGFPPPPPPLPGGEPPPDPDAERLAGDIVSARLDASNALQHAREALDSHN